LQFCYATAMSNTDILMQNLKTELLSFCLERGASLAGVADLEQARAAVEAYASSTLHHFPRAIAIAVPFPRSVIAELLQGPTRTYLHYYRSVNSLIDELCIRLTARLEAGSFAAFPVPSSQRSGKRKLDSIFPHRIAAYLAGLGWIGKSGCLVNATYGPRIRLGTVLTTAPLPADAPVADGCGSCSACVAACPAKAISGIPFSREIPFTDRFTPERCDSYQNEVKRDFGQRVCGLCLAVCPYGRPA